MRSEGSVVVLCVCVSVCLCVCVSVCLCVCVSGTILGLQATRRLMSASVPQGLEIECGDFAKTAAFGQEYEPPKAARSVQLRRTAFAFTRI